MNFKALLFALVAVSFGTAFADQSCGNFSQVVAGKTYTVVSAKPIPPSAPIALGTEVYFVVQNRALYLQSKDFIVFQIASFLDHIESNACFSDGDNHGKADTQCTATSIHEEETTYRHNSLCEDNGVLSVVDNKLNVFTDGTISYTSTSGFEGFSTVTLREVVK